jgi:acetolactate synthase-1/2/3 large subunit
MEKNSDPAIMTGAEILIDALKREGVDVIFGYPGATVVSIFDVLNRTGSIDFLLTRHEQGAAHAADGYARTTGKPGVCLVTSGPGATNTITGIATAKMDSVPMVILSGQVATNAIGSDAFQEADMRGLVRTICKHSYLVDRIEDLPQAIRNAFHVARSGRPGPVSLDLPKDVMTASLPGYVYPETPRVPGYRFKTRGNATQIGRLAEAVARAERPVVLAGGGIVISGAGKELAAFIEKANVPAAVTMMGLGCLPAGHRLNLGMPGMHGGTAADRAIEECDLLIGLGTRFDGRVTGPKESFAPSATIAQIDIDATEIGKNIRADIPIVGDLRNILADLTDKTAAKSAGAWNNSVSRWIKECVPKRDQDEAGAISSPFVIEALNATAPAGTIVTTDVGRHQMWAALFLEHRKPRTFLCSGGMGTMGFGLPAAMGATLGRSGCPAVCITGDGSVQMNIQELATCSINRIPVKIIVLNNSGRIPADPSSPPYWNEIYEKTCLGDKASRRSGLPAAETAGTDAFRPDLIKVAEANGMAGIRVFRSADVAATLREAFAAEGPVFMEFIVSPGNELDDKFLRRMR